jgi:hypothetical protein
MRGRFLHQQEASVPPQAVSPNFPVDAAPWRIATGTHPFGDLFKHEKGERPMTTQTETTKEKQIPAFYIFDTVESDGKKENKRVGAAYAHKKGTGYSFLINGKRYAAFPPKPKAPVQPEPGKGA